MLNKLISFIVPVFNTQSFLNRCLESIIKQDYPNIEIIIVNDGSTDRSQEIIDKYLDKYNCIQCINQSNSGVGAARNAGIAKAEGDYISFVDSDDCIKENFCSYLMNIIGDADIAVGGRDKYVGDIYKNSKRAPSIMEIGSIEAIKLLLLGMYGTRAAWGKIYKRSYIENIHFIEGRYFEETRYSFDTFANAKRVVIADKVLYMYRVRPESIMTTDAEKIIAEMGLVVQDIYQRLNEKEIFQICKPEFVNWVVRVIISNTRMFCNGDIDPSIFKDTTNLNIGLYDKLGGINNRQSI